MSTVRNHPILLLGLGNDILTDDAIGLHIVREVRRRLGDWPEYEACECEEMGLSLLDYIAGYRDLVLVDAVQTRQAPPGYLHEVSLDDLKVLPLMTPHFLGIGEILTLGQQLELPMPGQVQIFAVEVEDPFTLGTHLTPTIASALPAIADHIVAVIRDLAAKNRIRPVCD